MISAEVLKRNGKWLRISFNLGVNFEQGTQDSHEQDKNKLLRYSNAANGNKSHIEKQIIEKNKNEKALQKLKSLGGWLS